MDYNKIVKQSIELAWRFKSLWIFGLFVGGGYFNIPTQFSKKKYDFGNYFDSDLPFNFELPFDSELLILPVIAAVLAFILLSLIMYIISRTALIDAVNNIFRGGVYRFGKSFSAGVDQFLGMLGLWIIEVFSFIISFIVIAIPIIIMFVISPVLGVIGILLAIPFIFIIIFILTTIFELAVRAYVLRKVSISDSIAEGYELLRMYKWNNFIIFLISILIWIVSAIITTAVILIAVVPIGLAVYATSGIWIAFAVCIPIAFILMILFSGFLGTLSDSVYTLFYFELLELPNKNKPAVSSS